MTDEEIIKFKTRIEEAVREKDSRDGENLFVCLNR